MHTQQLLYAKSLTRASMPLSLRVAHSGRDGLDVHLYVMALAVSCRRTISSPSHADVDPHWYPTRTLVVKDRSFQPTAIPEAQRDAHLRGGW